MNNTYWISIAGAALIVGLIVGYSIWGPSAARVPELEKEVSSVQAQLGEFKKKNADLEANLGKTANEKLNLEKENAELKEAAEKAKKKSR
jgi:uncharacterized membrane-anchored protein YhcB (DUF1043 family)